MWAVNSIDQLEPLSAHYGFSAILLCNEFDTNLLNSLAGAFDTLNRQTGEHLHIVVPSKTSSHELNQAIIQPVFANHYDFHLALTIAEIYKIDEIHFPALVFDFFDNQEDPYIPLGGLSEAQMRQLIILISRHVNKWNKENDRREFLIEVIERINAEQFSELLETKLTAEQSITSKLLGMEKSS